jgi:hypothetical protein
MDTPPEIIIKAITQAKLTVSFDLVFMLPNALMSPSVFVVLSRDYL